MWSLEGTTTERASRLLGGAFGRLLYTRLNLSPRVLLKAAYGDRRKLTREIHARYLEPFPTRADRTAPWVLARDRIANTPSLLLWGMKDPTFGPDDLERWKGALDRARVVELPEAGHFAQEEAPDRVAAEVSEFPGGL